jgi:carbamoyl-phosphate synthase small subunit
MKNSRLILENGKTFEGESLKEQIGSFTGEVVFTTGMTGYVETLTDPSYAGQIIVFTYPLIGNYGVNAPHSWESKKIHARGVIVSTLWSDPSHYTSGDSLKDWLKRENIPFLWNIDTRAVTKMLRSEGTMKGMISCDGREAPYPDFTKLVEQVSVKNVHFHGSGVKKVVAVDCGLKENILRSLLAQNVEVIQVPFDYDYTHLEYDGLFLSNGPGDPSDCQKTIEVLRRGMKKEKPTFGICLGAQLMALAAGGKTFKLPFGHRGQNQPCREIATGRCFVTSQNHGYAVAKESLPDDWEITFENLNDGSCEGIAHKEKPFFGVQFHPEASPGPRDTLWLFEEFTKKL